MRNNTAKYALSFSRNLSYLRGCFCRTLYVIFRNSYGSYLDTKHFVTILT